MKNVLKLRHLAHRVRALKVDGALDAPVAALAYDARTVVPGAVFFAMPDREPAEGRFAIPRAIERGAAAIVCEHGGFLPYRATRIRVADCRRALALAAAAFHGEPSQKLQVVVVTGCAARVAVAHLLAEIFRAAGIPTGLAGSRGCSLGARTLPPLAPAAEALEVQECLAEMLRAGCRAGILELPPETVSRGVLAGGEVDHLVITRLEAGPGDVSALQSPGRAQLPEGWQHGVRLRPGPNGRRLAGGLWHVEDVLAGRAGNGAELFFRVSGVLAPAAAYRARLERADLRGTDLRVAAPEGGGWHARLRLPGRGLARAALAAAALALQWKLPLSAVQRGLVHAAAVPGRLEPVGAVHGAPVLVDATPALEDFEAALRELRDLTPGRLRVLFGCGWRHPAPERPAWGATAARWADDVILTDDNPGRESPAALAAAVAAGFAAVTGHPPRYEPDRAAAIAAVLAHAQAGDCVLLAGKGHHTVQELGPCVVPFDDRAVARACLHPASARPRTWNPATVLR